MNKFIDKNLILNLKSFKKIYLYFNVIKTN